MTHDYSNYTNEEMQLGDNAMARLAGLALQQKRAEELVALKQQELAEAQLALNRIAEKDLPELMAELKLETFTTSDGIKIDVKETVHASIPKPRNDEAMDWLDENGHEGLVKRQFVIVFNREDEKWARKFAADLAKRKRQLNTKMERKVESATLRSFVTRALEGGEAVPLDVFGVYRRRVSKVEVK